LSGPRVSVSASARSARGNPDPLLRIRRLLSYPEQSEMFANRLRKNWKRLRRWSRKESVSCYRLYDADLPEYAAALDLYEEALHVQEYLAPSSVNVQQAENRLRDLVLIASEVLDLEPDCVFVKVRKRQRGSEQYERLERQDAQLVVGEGGHRFFVNPGRLLGYWPVFGPPQNAGAAATAGVGTRLSQPFLLHGFSDGLRGQRRRAKHHQH
jgi:23S rRNA G2069 N7-methylase RlmK/C1962 C5-methylase RlmI